MQRSTRRTTLITPLALLLGACGTPPRLEIADSDRFMLVAGRTTNATAISVRDQRPDAQKVPARFGGWLQLGDASLEPTPPVALAQALQAHVNSRGASAAVRETIMQGHVELTHFQVLALNAEVESGFRGLESQTVPGVLLMDALITSLLRSTAGASKFRVVISFDVGDLRFSSDESSNFTANPGVGAPAQVLEKALTPIYRRFEIAFGPR